MKIKITSFFYFIFAATLIGCAYFAGIDLSQAAGAGEQPAERMADEILVKFKGSQEINVFKIAEENDLDYILNSYLRNPNVEYAESNYIYKISLISSDTYLGNQWYLQKIKAIEAWDKARESQDIVIAIMDSGVQIDHPDLIDNIWINKKEVKGDNIDNDNNGLIDDVNGWDFVNDVASPTPKFKEGFSEDGVLHGTVVAGVAAASGNNALGISGITWKAQIMSLKVLDDKGEGNTSKVIKGIDYAIANGANVINFSFVGFGYSKSLDDAIKRAYDSGIIVVAAAGNEQDNGNGYSLDKTPMYPACYDGFNGENRVIGVAATDALDQKAEFSSYGFKCVDIAAPGVGIYSTVVYAPTVHIKNRSLNKYYDGYWSGTSMAAPIISGAIALLEAVNPSLSRQEIVDTILNTSDNINKLNPNYLNQLGKGRLNLSAAVNLARNSLVSDVTRLIIAPFSNYKSLIKITDEKGKLVSKAFNSYADSFRGGVNIASGDLRGNNSIDIVTAPTRENSQIKIFDIAGKNIGQFLAFDKTFKGGATIAVGDVNNDGMDEIIAAAGQGGGPHIKIFNFKGELLGQFFAFDKLFRGGVNLAVGDIDGNGLEEIVVGAGPGGGSQVRIFNMQGKLIGQFLAYDKKFRGGVRVAVGIIDNGSIDNKAKIITAPGQGGGPQIRIFTNKGLPVGQFFAYNQSFRGGVEVATGDMDNDGFNEIVTGAGIGGAPHVRIFSSKGEVIESFYAYEANFTGGVNVSTLRGDNEAINKIIASSLAATSTTVK